MRAQRAHALRGPVAQYFRGQRGVADVGYGNVLELTAGLPCKKGACFAYMRMQMDFVFDIVQINLGAAEIDHVIFLLAFNIQQTFGINV